MYTTKIEDDFIAYSKKLSKATDDIPLKHAIKSQHVGLPKWRDRFVFMKAALVESLSYFAIVLSLITFTALTPQAIDNINGFFKTFGIGFVLPKTFSSIAILVVITFIFVFGILAYWKLGLAKSANEVANRYSPVNYLLFKELQEVKVQNAEILKKLKDGGEKGE